MNERNLALAYRLEQHAWDGSQWLSQEDAMLLHGTVTALRATTNPLHDLVEAVTRRLVEEPETWDRDNEARDGLRSTYFELWEALADAARESAAAHPEQPWRWRP